MRAPPDGPPGRCFSANVAQNGSANQNWSIWPVRGLINSDVLRPTGCWLNMIKQHAQRHILLTLLPQDGWKGGGGKGKVSHPQAEPRAIHCEDGGEKSSYATW